MSNEVDIRRQKIEELRKMGEIPYKEKFDRTCTIQEAREKLEQSLRDGSALESFKQFVVAQGGLEDEVLHPEKLPAAKYVEDVICEEEGFVAKIQTEEIGRISLLLGGGRETKESEIDLAVGLVLKKKRGDKISSGESLAEIHANDLEKLAVAKERLRKAYTIVNEEVKKEPVIKKVIK